MIKLESLLQLEKDLLTFLEAITNKTIIDVTTEKTDEMIDEMKCITRAIMTTDDNHTITMEAGTVTMIKGILETTIEMTNTEDEKVTQEKVGHQEATIEGPLTKTSKMLSLVTRKKTMFSKF